jgi:hypothetical protein
MTLDNVHASSGEDLGDANQAARERLSSMPLDGDAGNDKRSERSHMKRFFLVLCAVLLQVSSCTLDQAPTPFETASIADEIAVATSTQQALAGSRSLVDTGQRLGSGRSWDVSLGDLDGDNDPDAFVANGVRGEVGSQVWLNDGQGTFTLMEQDLGYGMGLELGDLDADGDLDVFIVGWEEVGRVWLNDGVATFVDSGQSLGSAGGWDVALGDLDGDDDLDALIAHENADTVWLNDGKGIFIDTGQGLGSSYTAAAGLSDLDGDGDLDALTVGWGEPGRVWLNDGEGIFTDSGQALTPGYLHIHGMTLGDMDGDGAADAFFAGSLNQVWFNDGNGNFRDSGQNLVSRAGDTVALGDVDGDGDLDAYLAVGDRGSSRDRLLLNDGYGNYVDSGLSLSEDFSSGIGFEDLDGDGDIDAFVVHGGLGQDSGGGIPNEVWLNEMQ